MDDLVIGLFYVVISHSHVIQRDMAIPQISFDDNHRKFVIFSDFFTERFTSLELTATHHYEALGVADTSVRSNHRGN